MQLIVAGAQIPVTESVSSNEAAILRAIAFAAKAGADMLVTPEGSLSGYTHKFDAGAVVAALGRVTAAAGQAHVGLALGTCFVEPADNHCYNQIRFYAPDGSYMGFHSKTALCGTLNKFSEGEITYYARKPLEVFRVNDVIVGGLICNDMWVNPMCSPESDNHLCRQLAGMGAKVIFHAVNAASGRTDFFETLRQFHEANLRMRARASRIWIVTVDNCAPVPDAPVVSPSGIISPDGYWVVRTPIFGERFFAQTIEIAEK
ncbi:MAG: carbon-nitrogen hydrolase family protein [Planctomycetes bacterium]|nr:carbon-nitrogen hydrolase family protein [Planctomycetota bacterium]